MLNRRPATPVSRALASAVPPATGPGSPDLLWSSNISGCYLLPRGPNGQRLVTLEGQFPAGAAADVVYTPGQYTYTLQCGILGGALTASTTINWRRRAGPVLAAAVLYPAGPARNLQLTQSDGDRYSSRANRRKQAPDKPDGQRPLESSPQQSG